MRALPILIAIAATLAAAGAPAARQRAPTAYDAALHLSRTIGPRPAASAAERRAHAYVAAQMRAAGLAVAHERFTVPGRGRSRDVIGVLDTPASCLTILMAHADSVPPAPGAQDNASGVGVLVALAHRLAGAPPPRCDTWLVATGAEERPYTRQADHLGALALVRRIRRLGRTTDLRIALSLDEVGQGRRFWLQSPVAAPRPSVEGAVLAAAQAAGARVRWAPDAGTGQSDHRELQLAGLPAAKLGPWRGAHGCRHTACDTWRTLDRVSLEQALAIAARTAGAG